MSPNPLSPAAPIIAAINLKISQINNSLGIVAVGAVSDKLGGGSNGLQWGLIYMLPLFALSVIANLILVKYYANDSAKCTDEVFAEK